MHELLKCMSRLRLTSPAVLCRVAYMQVRKLAGDVTDALSKLQAGFKRTLTADAKAFKGDGVAFRHVCVRALCMQTCNPVILSPQGASAVLAI